LTPVVKEEKKFSLFCHSSSLRSCIRLSFQTYRFSSKTEQFSFERLVYWWPERVLWPSPSVYAAILTYAAA
jgi:hypothetical protein